MRTIGGQEQTEVGGVGESLLNKTVPPSLSILGSTLPGSEREREIEREMRADENMGEMEEGMKRAPRWGRATMSTAIPPPFAIGSESEEMRDGHCRLWKMKMKEGRG